MISGLKAIEKEKAIELRRAGYSLRNICLKTKVSKSTLSGWLKNIELSSAQKLKLKNDWNKALKKARILAAEYHRKDKKQRLKKIKDEADEMLKGLKVNKAMLEVFLSALYLGEGFKQSGRTALGSSNPKILKTFILLLRSIYRLNEDKFRAVIYARVDQNLNELKNFWANLLNIPTDKFYKTQVDKRTTISTTYPNYHGVCAVYYLDTRIQRRLMFIAEGLSDIIASSSKALNN